MTDFWTEMDQFWNGTFWSGWVMAIVVINYGVIFFLFLWAPWVKIPTDDDGTTGHVWAHGVIREGLQRLPKWWLIISTISFISAFVYLTRYPGFGAHKGSVGWSSLGEMKQDMAANQQAMAPLWDRIRNTPVLNQGRDTQAMQLGERLFDDNCAACHGYGAGGNQVVGAPKLTDNTWEWGGSVEQITKTITDGRNGVMPPWEHLGYGKVKNVANYVMKISGGRFDGGAAEAGKQVFEKNCVACHGADGSGNQLLGAPDLTDDVWKWGGSLQEVITTIEQGRQGHMPAWKDRLNEDQIRVLTAWVLSHDNDEEAIAAQSQ